jgi:hypothetical protein
MNNLSLVHLSLLGLRSPKRVLDIEEYKIGVIKISRFGNDIRNGNNYFILIENQIGNIDFVDKKKGTWGDFIIANLVILNDNFILQKGKSRKAGYLDEKSLYLKKFKLFLDDSSRQLLLERADQRKTSVKSRRHVANKWISKGLNNFKAKKAITVSQNTIHLNCDCLGKHGRCFISTAH